MSLQYRLWISEKGVVGLKHMQSQLEYQQSENDLLKARNQALRAEIEGLKHGIDAVEERARRELGMIQKDETFYQIVEPEDGR